MRGKIIRLNTSNCSIESPRLCIPIGLRKGSRKKSGKAKEHCFTVQMNAATSPGLLPPLLVRLRPFQGRGRFALGKVLNASNKAVEGSQAPLTSHRHRRGGGMTGTGPREVGGAPKREACPPHNNTRHALSASLSPSLPTLSTSLVQHTCALLLPRPRPPAAAPVYVRARA